MSGFFSHKIAVRVDQNDEIEIMAKRLDADQTALFKSLIWVYTNSQARQNI